MKKSLPLIFGALAGLLFSAALVLYVVSANPTWLYGAFGASGLFGLLWAYESRAALKSFFTKKSTYYGANVAFIIALVLGILVFLNVAAKEFNWKKDITRSSVNSLSPQSLKVLHELKNKVKAYYFSSILEKERGEPLFKNFAYETKNFEYEFVDTARRPTFVQSMGVKKNETAVLTLVDSNKRITVDGISEEKITNGLIKLLKSKEDAIYFTSGHGERAFDGADPLGYTTVKAELEKQGYTVKELSLFSEGKIPEDASVIVIAGPTRAFFPKELELLSTWLKKGGRAIFALDLNPQENGLAKGSQQLADFLKAYGLNVQNRMLVDPTSKAANVEPQVLLGFSGSKEHAVTKDFAFSAMAANFLFPLTTHITAENKPGFIATPLVVTSQKAWAESDWGSLKSGLVKLDANDKQGMMALAFAAESEKKEDEKPMRIVVFGTSSFASDSLVDKVGNRDLFLNAAAWLADDEAFISIRAKEGEQLQSFDNNVLNLVLLVSVFLVPLLILIAGVVVWVRRSKL